MATMRGRREVGRYIESLPEALVNRVLRGAGRAAANVVADEARERSISSKVAADIAVTTKIADGRIVARVIVKGPGAYIARWLEYGTDPHFISVSKNDRQGLSVRKVNDKVKDGSLVINGQFVGETVWHPGAQRNPFLRVSLDVKEAEAIRAAQQYINSRISRRGIIGRDEDDTA